jgi:hypothetical protein
VGRAIRCISLWKDSFDGLGYSCAHMTLAITSMNNHIKLTSQGQLYKIAF